MRFGLDVAQQRLPWDEVVSRAQFAEELGFDGVWGFDHFQPMYGDGPGETFDGMTTLAALAGVTSRSGSALLVAGVTYRHPSIFAVRLSPSTTHRTAASSCRSARRGSTRSTTSSAFRSRRRRPASTCSRTRSKSSRGLSTGEVVSYDGKVVPWRTRSPRPAPVQQPHPPIGTRCQPAVPHVAARRSWYADVWHAWGSPNSLQDANRRIDELANAAGRDPSAIMRASSLSLDDLETTREHVSKWRDARCGYLVCGWPAEGRTQIERFARDVMPEFTTELLRSGCKTPAGAGLVHPEAGGRVVPSSLLDERGGAAVKRQVPLPSTSCTSVSV